MAWVCSVTQAKLTVAPRSFNASDGAQLQQWVYVPQGAFECNLTGTCPFFKNFHNPFRKKVSISILCFGIIRLQENPKTIRKIVYCS